MSDAPKTEKEWKPAGDRWKGWLKRFWWLCGAVAAMAMAALVPEFIDVSQHEALAALNAVILVWNEVCLWIGTVARNIPFLPILSAELISTVAFIVSTAVPAIYALERYSPEESMRSGLLLKSLFAKILKLPMIVIGLCFGVIASFYYRSLHHGPSFDILSASIRAISGIICLSAFIFALRHLSGYGRGVMFGIAFIIALGTLYLLNIP